ncbi:MAG: choice-of-anchor D domain-containing protein [Bryobacterales bacterium]|nr:choice-of-anchor D domain-containing protein [Bryobacterales bacterium]
MKHGFCLPFLALMLSAPRLHAEFVLYQLGDDGKETPVVNRVVMSDTTAGDASEVRFRLRNTGAKNGFVNSTYVRGAGFTTSGTPSFPFLVVPGLNMDFRVRFQPNGPGTFSGTLFVNDLQVFILGRSPDVASVWVDQGGAWRMVTNQDEVDFGRVQAHGTSALRFAFRNTGGLAVRVTGAQLLPGAFVFSEPLALPVELPPGRELVFRMQFEPLRGGIFRSTLLVDGRTIKLAGSAYEPPLPEPILSFPSATYESGRQQPLLVRFSEPARGNGVMLLTLTFTPQQGAPDDAAVQFVSNFQRKLSFDVRTGDEGLRWKGNPEILFQTGTTAGVIQFTITYDSSSRSAEFVIPAAVPQLVSAQLQKTSSTVVLTLSGFDNARSLSALSFTWYHKDGSVIGGAPLVSQVGPAFARYFSGFNGGGGFTLRAAFPVSGSPENIAGLVLEATNAAGSQRTEKIVF